MKKNVSQSAASKKAAHRAPVKNASGPAPSRAVAKRSYNKTAPRKTAAQKNAVNVEALVEIGATAIRLSIVEALKSPSREAANNANAAKSTTWNTLDRSENPITIGTDIFTGGTVKQSTISQCIGVLSRYAEQLATWGIRPADATVIGSSVLQEADNRDSIIDRIFIRTGFAVHILDGIEENRLMYLAVRECFKESTMNLSNEDYLILEAGGSSTEMLLLKKGSIVGAHSFKIGTARLVKEIGQYGAIDTTRRYVQQFILNSKNLISGELKILKVKKFIAVGKFAQIAALYAGKPVSTFLWEVPREKFEDFASEFQAHSIEECVARFKLNYNDALQMRTALVIYRMFASLADIKTIIVPEINLREGALINKIEAPDEELREEFYRQISTSALNLLRKYNGDEPHATYVAKIALAIYDTLQEEIALDARARVLLDAAATLHDVGMFIRMENHNLHSAYIIAHSEFFGLTKEEMTIITEIAKYHRGHENPRNNEGFKSLPRAVRMEILKLTAILRVADAIDRSHTQKFDDVKITRQKDSIIIETGDKHNIVMEKRAIAEKGEMFESVFGYNVILS